MAINFLKDITVDGKAGIGTSSPDAPLHVSRSTNGINQYIYNSSSGQAYIALGNATTGLFSQDFTSANGMLVGVDSDETAVIWNAENTRLRFGTNNSERLSITGGGYVGIGTTSPTTALQVVGRTKTSELHISNGNAIYTNTGNVGIGTTSPSYKLDVAGNIRVDSTSVAQIFLDSAASNDAVLNFHENASQKGKIGYDTSLGGFGFVAGSGAFSTADMVLLDGGNVGIGTTSPIAKLHLSGTGSQGTQAWFGNGFVNNASYHYDFARVGFSVEDEDGADTGAGFMFNTRNTADSNWMHGYIYQPQDGGIAFGTGGAGTTQATEKVRITSSGSVGIGTTSPGYKLDVVGNVRIQSSNEQQIRFVHYEGSGNEFSIEHDTTGIYFYNRTDELGMFRINNDGSIRLHQYGAGILKTDSSGNISIDTSTYFTSTGGTMTGNLKLNDNVQAIFGTGNDLKIYHEGTDSIIQNYTGSIYIDNNADDQDIIFRCDDGSGGIENYIQIDGSEGRTLFNKNIRVNDNVQVQVGSSADLQLYHNGTDSVISNLVGQLYIQNGADDKDIIFRTDNGSNGLDEYIRLDGSDTVIRLYKDTKLTDNTVLQIGDSADLRLLHDGTDSQINNLVGDLYIQNFADDKDVIFRSDDGSSNVTEYFRLDGSAVNVNFAATALFRDNTKAVFGNGSDLQIYHNGTHSYISDQGTGNLTVLSSQFVVNNAADTENMIIATADASVNLYYNGAQKFRTVSTGVEVTGGISSDGNAKSYTWRAVDNTSNTSAGYHKIARITSSQSTRFAIEIAGRSTSYGDGNLPAMGYIVGQLNNDNNYDIIYYNHSVDTVEVVTEVGQVDVDDTQTDIYVKVGNFAEVTAHAHISDGSITVDSSLSGSEEPTNYAAATEVKVFNSGGDISLGDSKKIKVGTGDDLQIYHDGSNSYINDSGTGELKIASDTLRITNAAGTETSAKFVQDSFVELFHNNSSKFKTTASGADVTGALSTTSGGAFGTDSQTASVYMSVQNQGLFGNFSGYARNLIKSNNSGIVEIGHASSLVSGISLVGGSSAVDGTITFSTKASERMRVHHNGNVGIGTTSPSTKFHVVDTGSTSVTHYLKFNNEGSSYGGLTIGSTGDDLKIRQNAGYGYFDATGYSFNYGTGRVWMNNGSILDVRNSSNSTVFYIPTSGNVGIGTTSPATVLDVVGEGTEIEGTGYYYNARFKDTANVGVLIGHNNTSNGNGMIAGVNKLAFLTYGTDWGERMVIDGDGNVGIGTNSPGAKLDVNGGAIIRNNLSLTKSSGNNTLTINSTGGGTPVIYMNSPTRGWGQFVNVNDLWFKDESGNVVTMVLQAGGNVGVGTTSPSEKLDVSGNVKSTGLKLAVNTSMYTEDATLSYYSASNAVYLNGAGNDGWLRLNASGASNDSVAINLFGTSAGNCQTFKTNSAERMRITSTGYVGINTTDPQEELTVNGDGNVTGSFAVGISSAHASYNFYNQGTAYFNGNITVDANLSLGDSDTIYLGAGNDLQIYHDGNNSYVYDNGTGELRLNTGNAVRIRKHDNETMALFTANGAVELYYDNAKKFETTSAGITVTGAITASGDITAFSDERLKEDIKPLEGSLEKVQAIEGVSFVKKNDEDKKQNIGFIAQQLKEVLPEVVHENEDGIHSVAYGNITALLVEAVKEQQEIIAQLEERIIDLENRL